MLLTLVVVPNVFMSVITLATPNNAICELTPATVVILALSEVDNQVFSK